MAFWGKSDEEKVRNAAVKIASAAMASYPALESEYPHAMRFISVPNCRIAVSVAGHQAAQIMLVMFGSMRSKKKNNLQEMLMTTMANALSNSSNRFELLDLETRISIVEAMNLFGHCAVRIRGITGRFIENPEELEIALGQWMMEYLEENGLRLSEGKFGFTTLLGYCAFAPFNPEVDGKSALWWK